MAYNDLIFLESFIRGGGEFVSNSLFYFPFRTLPKDLVPRTCGLVDELKSCYFQCNFKRHIKSRKIQSIYFEEHN